MTRRDDFLAICHAAGATVVDSRDGWPGEAEIELSDGSVQRVLIHAAPVTTHSREIAGEVRLQPPGQNRPVQQQAPAVSLLLGASTNGVVVASDAQRHIGRNERWTVTFRETLLQEAVQTGWATTTRPVQPADVETIYAFHPALLPAYVEMVSEGVDVATPLIEAAVAGSGLNQDPDDDAAADRARQATTRLVRDAAFSRDVREAYDHRCALCGLGLGLVVGAHVFPASAPGSQDEVWNGICLCQNHHTAFDRHLIHIDPNSRAVSIHPDVHAAAVVEPAAGAFVATTAVTLAHTVGGAPDVNPLMFTSRYAHFEPLYDWAA